MTIIYADLSCPFCYALSEWLDEAQLTEVIDWRFVDHNPQASFFSYSNQELVDLTEDLFVIRQRAPDISISLPQGRPNVRYAERLLCMVKREHPNSFFALKRLIYRAYWAQGANIESPEVLRNLLQTLQLPSLDFENESGTDIERWTREWNDGSFGRRIPVIKRSELEFNVGLPPRDETLHYIEHGELGSVVQSTSCDYTVRQHLVLLGDWADAWDLVKELRFQYDILFYADVEELSERCQKEGAPDLVLVRKIKITEESIDVLTVIGSALASVDVSTVVITNEVDPLHELRLYKEGYIDVIQGRTREIELIKITRLMDIQLAQEQMLKSSLVDSLTQLYNRRGFISILEKEWARSSRSKRTFSLMVIDVDYFKQFNDTYGHLAGDGCLVKVAHLIQSNVVRKSDVACRYGGDEFVVLLPDTDVQGATNIAGHILEAISDEKIHNQGAPLGYLSLSIGVASHKFNRELNTNDLLRHADEQLYEAKSSGRNTYKIKMFH